MARFENLNTELNGVQVEQGGGGAQSEFQSIPWGAPQPTEPPQQSTTVEVEPNPQPAPTSRATQRPAANSAPQTARPQAVTRPMPAQQPEARPTAYSADDYFRRQSILYKTQSALETKRVLSDFLPIALGPLLQWFIIWCCFIFIFLICRVVMSVILKGAEGPSRAVTALTFLLSPRLIYFYALMGWLWCAQAYAVLHNTAKVLFEITQEKVEALYYTAIAVKWQITIVIAIAIASLLAIPQKSLGISMWLSLVMAFAGVLLLALEQGTRYGIQSERVHASLYDRKPTWATVYVVAISALFVTLRVADWLLGVLQA